MQETKRLWKPREDDPLVDVTYVKVRAQSWLVRQLLQRMRDTGTWSVTCESFPFVLVRGWGDGEALAHRLYALGHEAYVLPDLLDW